MASGHVVREADGEKLNGCGPAMTQIAPAVARKRMSVERLVWLRVCG